MSGNVPPLFDALHSPALADRAKSGLGKQKTGTRCGSPGPVGVSGGSNRNCLGQLITAPSVSKQPLPPQLVPAAGMPRPFLRMSGGTLPGRDFRPPDSFGIELGNIWTIQCQKPTGTARSSQRWQASGVTINTSPGIRSEDPPEDRAPQDRQGSGNGAMGDLHVRRLVQNIPPQGRETGRGKGLCSGNQERYNRC